MLWILGSEFLQNFVSVELCTLPALIHVNGWLAFDVICLIVQATVVYLHRPSGQSRSVLGETLQLSFDD